MRLEKGKWYRWLGEEGGVALVESVGESSARVKIVTGNLLERDFETAGGDDVRFSSFETKHSNISSTSGLEPATDEEVARFVKRHKVIPVGASLTAANVGEAPKAKPRAKRQSEKEVRLDPQQVKHRKLLPCSYPKRKKDGGGTCLRPSPFRNYWLYEDGTKSFCRACRNHAERFAALHGIKLPDTLRRKRVSK